MATASQELDVDKSCHMSVFSSTIYNRIVIPWHPTLSLALCDWCCDATGSTLSKCSISKTTIEERHSVFVFRNLPTFVLKIGSGNKFEETNQWNGELMEKVVSIFEPGHRVVVLTSVLLQTWIVSKMIVFKFQLSGFSDVVCSRSVNYFRRIQAFQTQTYKHIF